MRDPRYVAVHRGGPLTLEKHRLLALWAADCAGHVLPLFDPDDLRPAQALVLARAWARGEISVGEARAASVAAHAAARHSTGAAQSVARACGHAVATAHMADHAPGAAVYALQALTAATDEAGREAVLAHEKQWQKACLPEEIRELVISTFAQKFARLNW